MIGCLARVAGLGLMMLGAWVVLLAFGFATLINPDPSEDWWPRYWDSFLRIGGAAGVVVGGAMVVLGGWLVGLPPEAIARTVQGDGPRGPEADSGGDPPGPRS